MVRTSWASSWRRAAGRLRPRPPGGTGLPGGGGGRRGAGGCGGDEQGVAPQQADQGQGAMQARPGAALVVPQAELLLPILVEALHGPPLMGEPGLAGQGLVVEAPGE